MYIINKNILIYYIFNKCILYSSPKIFSSPPWMKQASNVEIKED